MKKSEMIKRLGDSLTDLFYTQDGMFELSSQEKAEAILDFLEKQGMAPPLNKYVFHRWDEE